MPNIEVPKEMAQSLVYLKQLEEVKVLLAMYPEELEVERGVCVSEEPSETDSAGECGDVKLKLRLLLRTETDDEKKLVSQLTLNLPPTYPKCCPEAYLRCDEATRKSSKNANKKIQAFLDTMWRPQATATKEEIDEREGFILEIINYVTEEGKIPPVFKVSYHL
mmetsp:Transcript_4816/g.6849  ORF Transcript_4816/g.6849 Transcript_4816/m.6849 type:complete len:164 (+) Transcript_4816:111-602(+)